jgi:excisionase family DNA binding protein
MPPTQSRKPVSRSGRNTSAPTQTQAPVVPRLLTPEEVSVILGIPRLTVIRQSRVGKIPAVKIGKCYRYHAATITSWLSEQAAGGAA